MEPQEQDAPAAARPTKTFDAAAHLRRLDGRGGAAYLDVKWRLVWLRSEHPDAELATEHIEFTADRAVFRAHIAIPGGGTATGYGSETPRDFGDYIEKAETKAIGRACAALGYGTQFCQDHDLDNRDGTPHVVDTPVDRSEGQRHRRAGQDRPRRDLVPLRPAQDASGASDRDQAAALPATEQQIAFAKKLAAEAGLDDEALAEWCQELYGRPLDQLSRRDASALMDAIRRRQRDRS